MRRVVVTGMGALTPVGNNLEDSWKNLIAGQSGAGKIKQFDTTGFACNIACEVNEGDGTNGTINIDDWVPAKDRRRFDKHITYGLIGAEMAIKDAGIDDLSEEEKLRTGCVIGAGIGGLQWIADNVLTLESRGPRRVSPHFIAGSIANLVSGNVSIKHGFKGPNSCVVTACATGTHCIGDAARMIMLDDADIMLAGGSEGTICPVSIAGFSQAKALSTKYNDTPEKASRPWDQGRDGFVMGEGSGILVLEEYEHAKARGAKIYGEVVGYGLSGDAYHVTAPAPDGNGGFRAMQAAMKRTGFDVDKIDYINAHGTSTPLGDELEFGSVKRLLGDAAGQVAMSSTKSAVGHLLGAAGAVEAIFSLLAMRDNVVPPTLNLDNPSESCTGMNLVPHEAQQKKVDVVLSNSFGFGGTNGSVIFKSV
ncbi:beta-ketoacyl-ACP synthase II [Temperatibacter marinus]|uniref:3-oxoacyl-[acyl-carrier-protein] synthase 2 n=1 Tax=Temperatibacter marinus TaxID=1456591 RepID=A0AA52H8Z8_9PROT|nr:beta-ketoacyl-ACP synthase II [Temperatibacter marinus]WND02349.1 beta-ketoacyl-ACP synthase II [Temperatibacter marinus]